MLFSAQPGVDYPDSSKEMLAQRDGYYGWMGYGGSVFQWHPELEIGFAYTPTLLAWYDLNNTRGGELQKEVVECVKRINQK